MGEDSIDPPLSGEEGANLRGEDPVECKSAMPGFGQGDLTFSTTRTMNKKQFQCQVSCWILGSFADRGRG
jgi:hypothetical protein